MDRIPHVTIKSNQNVTAIVAKRRLRSLPENFHRRLLSRDEDGRPAVAILMFNMPRATNESHAEDVVAHGSSSGSIEHETLPPLQNGDTRAPLFRGQKRDGQGWLHEREFVVLLLGLLYIPLSPSPTETL